MSDQEVARKKSPEGRNLKQTLILRGHLAEECHHENK